MTHTEPRGLPGAAAPDQDAHTRNRLLCAAVQIFDRKGYASASVREIVELAGVSKPALYYHFGSKEGLLAAILEAAAGEFGRALEAAAGSPGRARDRLHRCAEVFHGMIVENVSVARVAHAVFTSPAEAAPRFDFTVFDRHARAAFGRIVADGLAAGEIRPAAAGDVALAVMGIAEAAAARRLHPGFAPVERDDLRRTLDLVFDGIFVPRVEQGELTS